MSFKILTKTFTDITLTYIGDIKLMLILSKCSLFKVSLKIFLETKIMSPCVSLRQVHFIHSIV